MSFLDRLSSIRDRSRDSSRQVKYKMSDFHDKNEGWGDFDETPAQKAKREEGERASAAAAAERQGHEKRTGVPSTFMPNVSRVAPAGVEQIDHDRALQKAHQASQARDRGEMPESLTSSLRTKNLNGDGDVDVYTHPSSQSSSLSPVYHATVRNARIQTVYSPDRWGMMKGAEHIVGSNGHSIPLADVHSVDSAPRVDRSSRTVKWGPEGPDQGRF